MKSEQELREEFENRIHALKEAARMEPLDKCGPSYLDDSFGAHPEMCRVVKLFWLSRRNAPTDFDISIYQEHVDQILKPDSEAYEEEQSEVPRQ